MTIPTNNRAIVYLRVSTVDQSTEQEQLDACRAYAERNGLIIVAVYSEKVSGTKDDRREYRKMEEAFAEGKAAHLIAYKVSRVGRHFAEGVRLAAELEKRGIKLHFPGDGGELSPLTRNILASVAEDQSRQQSEHIRLKTDALAAKGIWLAGKPPYGYLNTYVKGEGGHLIPDPDTAPIVQAAFAAFLDGGSIRSVARRFRWKHGIARKHLTNPVYIGDLPKCSDAHPALISREDFAAVQSRLALNATLTTAARSTAPHLLTGLIKCAECGHRLRGHHGSAGRYRHSEGHRNPECFKSWPKSQVESYVLAQVEALRVLHPEAVAREAEAEHRQRTAAGAAERKSLAERRETLAKESDVMARRYLLGEAAVDAETYSRIKTETDEAIRLIDNQLDATPETPPIDLQPLTGRLADDLDTEGIRELLRLAVASVALHGDGTPKITWTDAGLVFARAAAQTTAVPAS